jgi:predicted O-methyltransferase YrrM
VWATFLHSSVAWLTHSAKASGPHGIHSPFVFELITRICVPERHFLVFDRIEEQRALLWQDHTSLHYADPGAGSRAAKGERSVHDIALKSLQLPEVCRFLFQLSLHMGYKKMLELGTSLGVTTAYLASTSRSAEVITIEGARPVAERATVVWKNLSIENICSITATFNEALPEVIAKSTSFDLVYIDGHHLKDPTLRYFRLVWPKVSRPGCVVMDDIYWSAEMTEAWKEVCMDPDVTLVLDFFRFGLVFKNPDFSREYIRVFLPR